MTDYPTELCGSCGKEIVMAVHERTLKPGPICVETSDDGNVVLIERPGLPPLYRVLNATQRFGRTGLHKSHFADCPKADRYRRGR
jgi:hypothetical protein